MTTIPDEVIERVAKAIFNARVSWAMDGADASVVTMQNMEGFRRDARAAIDALMPWLREVTYDMVRAWQQAERNPAIEDLELAWATADWLALLDAKLKGPAHDI